MSYITNSTEGISSLCFDPNFKSENITFKPFISIQATNTDLAVPTNLIFTDKSTVIKWSDGTETHVAIKDGESFDREKAVLYCIVKKKCGSLGILDKIRKINKNEYKAKVYELAINNFMKIKHKEISEKSGWEINKKKRIEEFDKSNFEETKEFIKFYKDMLKQKLNNFENF
jgi:hypothetical protein